MAQPNIDQNESGNSEDTVSLKALSDEDLAYIANNPGYLTMLQDILSPIIGEPSRKDGRLTTLPPATRMGVVLTIPAPPIEKECLISTLRVRSPAIVRVRARTKALLQPL